MKIIKVESGRYQKIERREHTFIVYKCKDNKVIENSVTIVEMKNGEKTGRSLDNIRILSSLLIEDNIYVLQLNIQDLEDTVKKNYNL
jgi:hypothetical protein